MKSRPSLSKCPRADTFGPFVPSRYPYAKLGRCCGSLKTYQRFPEMYGVASGTIRSRGSAPECEFCAFGLGECQLFRRADQILRHTDTVAVPFGAAKRICAARASPIDVTLIALGDDARSFPLAVEKKAPFVARRRPRAGVTLDQRPKIRLHLVDRPLRCGLAEILEQRRVGAHQHLKRCEHARGVGRHLGDLAALDEGRAARLAALADPHRLRIIGVARSEVGLKSGRSIRFPMNLRVARAFA